MNKEFRIGSRIKPKTNDGIRLCKQYGWDGVSPIVVIELSKPNETPYTYFDLPQYKRYAIYNSEMEVISKKPTIIISEE